MDVWLDQDECAKLPGGDAAAHEVIGLRSNADLIARAAGWRVCKVSRGSVSFLADGGGRIRLKPSDEVFHAMLRMAAALAVAQTRI
jgi:hypothetical protein